MSLTFPIGNTCLFRLLLLQLVSPATCDQSLLVYFNCSYSSVLLLLDTG